MRKAGLLEYGSKTCLIGVTAGATKREFTGLPAENTNTLIWRSLSADLCVFPDRSSWIGCIQSFLTAAVALSVLTRKHLHLTKLDQLDQLIYQGETGSAAVAPDSYNRKEIKMS